MIDQKQKDLEEIIKNQHFLILELREKVNSLSEELEANQSAITKLLKKYTELLKQ